MSAGLIVLVFGLAWWLRPFAPREPSPPFTPIVPAGSRATEEGAVVYSNDFEATPGSTFPEWTSSAITCSNRFGLGLSGTRAPQRVTNIDSPEGGRRFLGEFGGPRLDPTARTRVRQTIRLVLKGLAPHSRATVSFDLLVLKSWDGSSPWYGPDRWGLKVAEGPTLLDTTFSNNPKVDSDRSFQDFPRPGSPPQKGASAVRTLGYRFFGDSRYHLSFAFPHASATLTLEFSSDLVEGKGIKDESWGLDNVVVRVVGDLASIPRGPRSLPAPVSRSPITN